MTYEAAQSVLASGLRESVSVIGLCPTDVPISNDDLILPVPGLSVLLEPETFYALDGYIAYDSGTTADIRFALRALGAPRGSWVLYRNPVSEVTGIGAISAVRNDFLDEVTAAGSGAMAAQLVGYVRTGMTAGGLQVEFAQAVADPIVTQIRGGSWIRATRRTPL